MIMMYLNCKIVFTVSAVLYSCIGLALSSENDYDGPLSITLYHSVQPGIDPVWQERGQITVQNVVTGDISVSQSQVDFNTIESLQALANRNGIYRLKAVVKTSRGREVSFLSFVKACLLVESGLSDTITISVDQSGSVIAVTESSVCSICEGIQKSPSELQEFNTTIFFKNIEQGPMPDTASYIQKMEREREARERGETKDNRSFFAKYWIYIVVFFLFIVVSSVANPEAGAAGGR